MKNKITIQAAKAQQNSFKFHLNNLPFLTFAYKFYKKLFDPSNFHVDDNQIVRQNMMSASFCDKLHVVLQIFKVDQVNTFSKSIAVLSLTMFFAGCGGGSDEPKLKAVEPPDSPVKTGDAPKGDRFKGSSGAMKKNPGESS